MRVLKRIVVLTAILIGVPAAVHPTAQTGGASPAAPTLGVGVLCVVSERSAFPFPAGTDRCFREINGKTIEPRFAAACFLETSSGPRLRFLYSAVPKPSCGGRAAYGEPATKDQYDRGLASLAQREREFFLKQIASAR